MRALLAVAISIVLVNGCARPPAMSAASTPQLYTPSTEPDLTPPSLVTPTPPRRTRSYATKLAVLDLILLVTVIPVLSWAEDDVSENMTEALGTLYAATYLFGGPWIHSLEGNHGQVGPSVGRRLGYPALGILAGLFITGAFMDFECDDELCFLPYFFGGIVGGGVGAIVGAVVDWTKAKVEL
jgi:hypothetical protein